MDDTIDAYAIEDKKGEKRRIVFLFLTVSACERYHAFFAKKTMKVMTTKIRTKRHEVDDDGIDNKDDKDYDDNDDDEDDDDDDTGEDVDNESDRNDTTKKIREMRILLNLLRLPVIFYISFS